MPIQVKLVHVSGLLAVPQSRHSAHSERTVQSIAPEWILRTACQTGPTSKLSNSSKEDANALWGSQCTYCMPNITHAGSKGASDDQLPERRDRPYSAPRICSCYSNNKAAAATSLAAGPHFVLFSARYQAPCRHRSNASPIASASCRMT